MAKANYLGALGPGLLFAGAAVGTSHLVQSTRAGAVFGLGLLAVVVLANLVKYPAFRIGAHFAAVTGKDLVVGYRNLGRFPPLFLAAVLILADGFAVAALSLVTAGILGAVTGLQMPLLLQVAMVMAAVAAFLVLGGFTWLDRINKLFMMILTISTLAATLLALPSVDWVLISPTAPEMDVRTLLFIAALAGWMPTAMESSVFASLWTVEKAKSSSGDMNLHAVMMDFNIGYWGTAVLAVCFLLLGAGILHPGGVEPADTAPAFAIQIMGLYRETLGPWAVPLVGVAAISVMFTTCLTAFDGVIRTLLAIGRSVEVKAVDSKAAYGFTLVIILVAAFLLLLFFLGSFKLFIDFVTSLAFVTAPVLAWFNHRAMVRADIPADRLPPAYLMAWSRLGILLMGLFAIGYLWLVFG